jgi:ppGpp synthetase/RelA/SpoT-type nucleotidyltranferase
MNEREFRSFFSEYKTCYETWGKYVVDKIKNEVSASLIGRSVDSFFKVPPCSRVKDEESLVQKAFYRGKGYSNPWLDITDKVGCRFVVLLLSDIKLVQDVVESISEWSFSKDRDFYKEKENEPERFAYQSIHYVVRNKSRLELNNEGSSVIIPENTPCEIQIRTLMQHAYSEMTHDSIYKSDVKTQNDIIRIASRCSAMIETTDELFENVNERVMRLQKLYEDIKNACSSFIEKSGVEEYKQNADDYLTKAFFSLWNDNYLQRFISFLADSAGNYLKNESRLANVSNLQILFLAKYHNNEFMQCVRENRIDSSYLEDVFSILGIASP